ncbi:MULTISPECIES: acyl-CoA reductase [unclassified Paraflavitalea]|uniref:acyl-CoA reductase n=1 Tax=unclassified Paraflavitalea TaxID=2798305 RepID=UPI003D34A847
MNVQQRIELLEKLRNYILSNEAQWEEVKLRASQQNGWFIPEFIELAINNIAVGYLSPEALQKVVVAYQLNEPVAAVKKVGIIMAGNIPLVGFHDLLCCFLAGHQAMVKLSSKDEVLMRHIIQKLGEWAPETGSLIQIGELLKGCDAYIATGSNNTARYFEQYFGKYPHIIRKNRTSAALLDGTETAEQLASLADDVFQYFGLGCRNVTKLYVPKDYDFIPLLEAFKKYASLADHHKFKNNYDYQLAILIINKKFYMTNGNVLLYEDASLFSPISQLNYEFYESKEAVIQSLQNREDLQVLVGTPEFPLGSAQCPGITDFADGVDTLKFLRSI